MYTVKLARELAEEGFTVVRESGLSLSTELPSRF